MARCDYCGATILFGGKREGNLRFCNERCRKRGGVLLTISKQIPDVVVREKVWQVHQGTCPKCGGNGPVDVHPSYRVWSALFYTRWNDKRQLSCRSCGLENQLEDAVFSFLLGWWGIPVGLVMTPVQVGRNLVKAAHPPEPSRPSAELEKFLRMTLAKRMVAAAQAEHSGANSV